jgi:hypothetical protein
MGLLAGLVVAAPWTGFEISVTVFLAAALALYGERRLWVLVAYPLLVAILAVGFFASLLSVPLPSWLFAM